MPVSSMHLASMSTSSIPSLPTARSIRVDTRGAVILNEESPEVRRLALLALKFRLPNFYTDKGQQRDLPSEPY